MLPVHFVRLCLPVLVTLMPCTSAFAQNTPPAPPNPRAAPPASAPPAAVSAAQLQKVKEILAPYKASKLSADDAKLIKRQLRDAGMRPSPALEDAMRAAGLPLQKLDELDPRPPGPPPDAPPAAVPAPTPASKAAVSRR